MRVLIIFGHPCKDSFNGHLLERATETLEQRNEVRVTGPYEPGETGLIEWAEAIVWIYPTWWSSVPAAVIEWLDREWGVDRSYPNIDQMLAITTHGSGRIVNTLEGNVGKRLLLNGLAGRCAPNARAGWIPFFNIDRASAGARARFVRKMERKLETL